MASCRGRAAVGRYIYRGYRIPVYVWLSALITRRRRRASERRRPGRVGESPSATAQQLYYTGARARQSVIGGYNMYFAAVYYIGTRYHIIRINRIIKLYIAVHTRTLQLGLYQRFQNFPQTIIINYHPHYKHNFIRGRSTKRRRVTVFEMSKKYQHLQFFHINYIAMTRTSICLTQLTSK